MYIHHRHAERRLAFKHTKLGNKDTNLIDIFLKKQLNSDNQLKNINKLVNKGLFNTG